ncbi:hypothetical protein GOP47_0005504 [Adiantum capillus-veneris]|uniref:Uncharacterized protein n=1 Tax=Adiantum capillus-veneris TaxID=13818 RepID=A0A9D4V575_ADICA|nr:hypothetical protein GOP47_0005504 [Adiantum capillus-veneris]
MTPSTSVCPVRPVTSKIDLQCHPQRAEHASNPRDAHDGHHHRPKCNNEYMKTSAAARAGGGEAANYGSRYEVPLFCCPVPPLPSDDHDVDDESPPDSPSMPWRPGSSAYPPPSPAPIFPASAMAPLHAQNDPTTHSGDHDDATYSSPRQSKKELQQLYDSLCEASYDLSLRDIVEPPFSIHGTLVAPLTHAVSSKPLPSSQAPPRQGRSQSCRKSGKCIDRHSSSDQCKLAFSFSFPRSNHMAALPLPNGLSSDPSLRNVPLRLLQENVPRTAPSPLPKLAHVLSTPDDQIKPASSPLSGYSSSRSSFKRSFNRTAAHRPPLAPPLKLKERSSRRMKAQKQQLIMRAGGSSSRVHPSSQCSACASYTIFFKSRCMVCGRLYCSNCAKEAMDLGSAGRRCKSSCKARLGSGRRFSKSVKSKCWPLCGNNDLDVSKDPIVCKSVC